MVSSSWAAAIALLLAASTSGCDGLRRRVRHTDEPSVAWTQNFNSQPLGEEWFGEQYTQIVEGSAEGDRNLRVEYVPNHQGSPRVTEDFGMSPSTSATISFDVFFEQGFEFVRGGKLGFGLRGGSGTTGCAPIAPDGWSARIMWGEDGTFEVYYYHQDRESNCGDRVYAIVAGETVKLQAEQWYKMSLYVKVNDLEESNGEVALFLDGAVVGNRTGIRWRAPCSGADCQNSDVTRVSLSTFYGGSDASWAPSKTTYALYDNVEVAAVAAPGALCQSGILNGDSTVCCGECGGRCSGSGCGGLPGGASECCGGTIERSGRICQLSTDVGCAMP